MLTLHPVPAFSDNYIWVLHDQQHCLVVDPGDANPVLDYIKAQGLTPCAVLITHHHPDHVGGLVPFTQTWPGVPVLGPAQESITGLTRRLSDGDHAAVPELGLTFEIMLVPGHTLGHIAFYTTDTDTPTLFCGDTLFAAGCGRLFEGTPAQMLHSLDRLTRLPDDTRVCCAHEYTLANLRFALAVTPEDAAVNQRHDAVVQLRDAGKPSVPSSLAEEKRSNPFLRVDDEGVANALLAREPSLSRDDRNGLFATLRQWKDNF